MQVDICHHSLRNPLDPPRTELYVWELDRSPPEPALASDDLLSQLKDEKCLSASETELRTSMVDALKRSLNGDPAYNETSKLWEWLNKAPIAQVACFFCEIVSKLKDINLYVVEHSPLVSYCTGSHNNAVYLGSSEQAKGALFYITPYLIKNKIALEHCLTVMQKVREHVELYPSKAKTRARR
jgi:hypothetical protein